jgi:hypothetical protein
MPARGVTVTFAAESFEGKQSYATARYVALSAWAPASSGN